MPDTIRDRDGGSAVWPSDALYREMFERAGVGLAQAQPFTSDIVRVNAAFCELTGYSERELLAMSLDDLSHPDDRGTAHRAFLAAAEPGAAGCSEHRYVRKDRHVVWVRVQSSALREAGGNTAGATLCVVQDVSARKQAEEAARASEDRLRQFVEGAQGSVAMLDRDMRYLAASSRWKGASRIAADIIGRSHYEVFPDLPERWKEVHRRALAGEAMRSVEDVFVSASGRTQWFNWEARPWRGADGEIGGIFISAEEVTERVIAQQRVEASESQLRFVTDHAPAMLVHCDSDGRLVFANRPYADRFGLRPEDVVGKRIVDVVGAGAYEQLRPFIESALAGAQAEFEEVVSYPYGTRWMRCTYTPELAPDGTVRGFVAVIQDITARRQAEEALRTNDAKLQAFLDASPVALVRTTRDLRYRAVNAAYARLIDCPADRIVGRTLAEVLGEDTLERIRPYLERVAAGERVEFEEELAFAGSSARWVQAIYTPERDAAGDVAGWVVAITDISDRKRTEAALRSSERLQRLLAEVGDVAARITDVPSLMSAVGERIAAAYDISRCGFALLDTEAGKLLITDDYHGELPSVAGVYPLDYHTEYWKDEAVAGRTVMLPDLALDPRSARHYTRALEPLQVRAQLMVPLYRDGRWVATFWVSDSKPHQWTPYEAESLKLVGERLWSVVERSRAEDAVRASEEHLRLITDQAPVLLVHCDREMRYRFANTPYTERFGLRSEQVVGRRIPEVIGDRAYEAIAPYVTAALRGERIEFEQDIPYAFGTRWMHCTYVPQTSADGAVKGLIAVIQDVTARRLAEESLRESEERFRATFENAAVGMAHVALDGTLVRVNDRLCVILGHTRDQLRHLTLEQLTHPDERSADREHLHEVLAGERQTYSVEKRHIRGDGSLAWTTLTVSLVRTADQSPAYFIAIVEDITARKRAEEALRDAARHKDEFLAMLAHELRNPLAPIRTAAGLLATCEVTDPTVVRSRSVIERQVTHMARLLDDLLDVSRLSRGTLPLQRAPVLLKEILRAAIEVSAPMFAERGQHLTVDGVDDQDVLDADRERLTQVFANLLNNAANYSGRGANVHLAVRRDGSRVSVAVRDYGIGIAPEMIDKIFELFMRTHAAEEHAPGGLGIGLSLARRVVELHGGTLAVVSDGVGRGSEFTVHMPATPVSPVATVRAQPAEEILERGEDEGQCERRVLVVDDNADAADMLELLLSGVGCEVRTAYRGQMAVQEAERFRPDLVLLDIGLPDISGHEVCRRIREQPWGQSMMIVAVTGWGQDADRQRSTHAGFDRHLVKPVDHDEIIALAREARNRES